MLGHSLLSFTVSDEKSADNLTRIPFYGICSFSIAAFNIFSLPLTLVSVTNMCLRMFLLGFALYGICCASWTWVSDSFHMFPWSFKLISSNNLHIPFSLSFPFGTPVLVHLNFSQSSLRLSSFLFLYYALHQWFPLACTPSYLFIPLPPVFCYCFLLVIFKILIIVLFI